MVGVADHPLLDRVDVRLRVLVDPSLVAAVLGRVHGHEPRHAGRAGEAAGGAGHQPVVGVHEVDVEALDQVRAGGAHVLVHVVDPRDEGVEVVLREVGLPHAVDRHAVAVLNVVAEGDREERADRLAGETVSSASREDVDFGALGDELLGQLAHVAREPALDDRGVLPGEDQDARRHGKRR